MSSEMFNNYQNIDSNYVPDNSSTTEIAEESIPMTGINSPSIIIDGEGNQTGIKSLSGNKIIFDIQGNIYTDNKEKITLISYLVNKQIAFRLYNFRGELISVYPYIEASTYNEITLEDNLPGGIYRCAVDLLDAEGNFLVDLFHTTDGTILVEEEIKSI